MGQYDYSYDYPENFQDIVVRLLNMNGHVDMAQKLQLCTIDYRNLGYAHYAGLSGDTWNMYALDFTIAGPEKEIVYLKSRSKELKRIVEISLKPNSSGFLPRKLDFVVDEAQFELSLPTSKGETFDVLSRDINDALIRNEPALVLDRLHTYTTKYLRELCKKHTIEIIGADGKYYPLHSLVGKLTKYYCANSIFKSNFVEQAIKMSISTFDNFNEIRNNKSYAHDNDVLDKDEARFVVEIVSATLSLIHSIEE